MNRVSAVVPGSVRIVVPIDQCLGGSTTKRPENPRSLPSVLEHAIGSKNSDDDYWLKADQVYSERKGLCTMTAQVIRARR